MATALEQLIDQIYQEQLGRAPDEGGKEYYLSQLESGRTPQEIAMEINQSREGQNFDIQKVTSLYRQVAGREGEQEGFQYWLSEAQAAGYTPADIQRIFEIAAQPELQQRGITPGQVFTELQTADLQADPFGGRYVTESIYDLLPDAVNVSMIGDRQAQFATPANLRPVVSQYTTGGSEGFNTQAGMDVINAPAVQAAIQRALDSGAMTPEEYRTMFAEIDTARKSGSIDDFYAALNKPQAQIVIDAIYGQQTGEANTMAQARAEAAQRQAVLDANNLGYYQNNFALADAYRAAGLDFPFGTEAFQGYDTRTGQGNVVTDENFNSQVGNLVNTLYGQFGGAQDMITPLSGQYYSEAGLQPGFTPFGTEGTTFRSGVAGYTPNLPRMFQFGAPPVDASFQQYRPGAFQPAGVTTGGFITGYNADGTPIYSTYNNPNVNVGGATSQLNPFTPVQSTAIADLQAQLDAINAAAAANQSGQTGG
jgi:hypothetical protein